MTSSLWAPWRLHYVRQTPAEPTSACFLCDAINTPQADAAHFVIDRTPETITILNRYPYTNGHLMIVPTAHVAKLTELSTSQRSALMEQVTLAQQYLEIAMNPMGFNIGINTGRCAGAGLPGHLHVHLVPRWAGDTNFMDVVGEVNVIPQALEAVYQELIEARNRLKDDAHPTD